MWILLLMATLVTTVYGQSLYDQFFDEYYFPFNPTAATFAGVHEYDGKLEDYSRAGVERKSAALDQWLVAVGTMPAPTDPAGLGDRELVWWYLSTRT